MLYEVNEALNRILACGHKGRPYKLDDAIVFSALSPTVLDQERQICPDCGNLEAERFAKIYGKVEAKLSEDRTHVIVVPDLVFGQVTELREDPDGFMVTVEREGESWSGFWDKGPWGWFTLLRWKPERRAG